MPDGFTLPGWPAAMGDAKAAAYLDLSPNTFKAVMERDGIQPIRPTPGRKLWRRRDLDSWLDRQGGDVPASVPLNPWHQA